MDDPFKEYFQRLKTCQFWGPCPIFFSRSVLGFGVYGSKLHIIHWFQCQAKVGLRHFMEFRNTRKKVPPLLRVTVVGMLIPILLLFNVYLMIYLNLYPTRAKLEFQRFTIAVYMYIWIIRENYSAIHSKQWFFLDNCLLLCNVFEKRTRCFEV
jgi:hypothetical protein